MEKIRLFGRRFWCLVAVAVICLSLVISVMVARAATGGGQTLAPAWANPEATALRRVSDVASAQNEPNFFNNMDCSLQTFRLVNSNDMQTRCFTPAAFGTMDSDSNTAIFNGTDEALPLIPYVGGEVLVPWPKAMDLIAIDSLSTDGDYISLYKNPLGALHDERDAFGRLTAKRLTAPAELLLVDASGQRLVVNPQTLAFSDNGSWMVVETLTGSFVRVNLATLEVRTFAPAIIVQGNPALFKSRVTISDDGRYVAIVNESMQQFKVYDLTMCSDNGQHPAAQWCQAHEYWPFVDGHAGELRSVRHVRFVNQGLLSFEVVASDPGQDGIYELAPSGSIDFLTDYIGLGDSYTSGEGAFNYLAGTDTSDNICHLSANSYPLLLTRDLFGAAGGHSVACSGAVIQDIGSTSDSYRGQVKGGLSLGQLQQTQPTLLDSVMANFVPGYVAQQAFVRQYQPRVMTVSVGGNDVGFGDILQNCVVPKLTRHQSDDTCYNTYEARLEVTQLIDRTVPRWTALYKQLLAEAPGTHLYAIGYPQVVDDAGSCALNVQMGKSELEFAVELTNYLNDAVKKAAGAAQVPYVDIGQALTGHRLCETASYDVAVNGLTAGNDFGVLG
ncbi:MAG: SGNH/GDSL hydrolase family protein, partial [Candidatus Saccharimonadales bacterium]